MDVPFISFRAARAKGVWAAETYDSNQEETTEKPVAMFWFWIAITSRGRRFQGIAVGYQFLPRAGSFYRIKILLQKGKSANAFQGLGPSWAVRSRGFREPD